MSYKKRKLNNRGFSLVEVLVAIVILAIISLPVLSTFSNAARINARARRTENANTAINNIIEEAKTMSLENLVNRQGQYYYAPTTDNNTYVVSDERGVSYYTGVNGEKYYIKATFSCSNTYTFKSLYSTISPVISDGTSYVILILSDTSLEVIDS